MEKAWFSENNIKAIFMDFCVPVVLYEKEDMSVLFVNQALLNFTDGKVEEVFENISPFSTDISTDSDNEYLELPSKKEKASCRKILINKETGEQCIFDSTSATIELPDGNECLLEFWLNTNADETIKEELAAKSIALIEAEITLKVMLRNIEEERMIDRQNIALKLERHVIPLLEPLKMRLSKSNRDRKYVDMLETINGSILNLCKNINIPKKPTLSNNQNYNNNLSPTEDRISHLIKIGYTMKEIANILTSSIDNVKYHIKSLRRKLGLRNTGISLKNYYNVPPGDNLE